MDIKQLIEKYNVPVPRYNCYPAPPYWDIRPTDPKKWLKAVSKAFSESNGMGLYIHMPFCENLCTFCGFEKRITQNHFVEDIYIDALIKQWQIYLNHFDKVPQVNNLYMGGGTPTFFGPKNLDHLFQSILPTVSLNQSSEITFEAHPNNTSKEHLQVLYDHGFRTVSYGIQDFDETVLKSINRIQPFENVKSAINNARKIGYKRIKFDLIYGLPHQSAITMKNTMEKVADFMPDVIAFYSYLHVPWDRPSQKGIKDTTLPQGVKKINLFDIGKEYLLKLGYKQVGIDHFALKKDPLYKAYKEKNITRDFTGYNSSPSDMLIGLGAIAVSDVGTAYAQNIINVEDFHDKVFSNHLPLAQCHYLTPEDILLKKFIHDIICNGEAGWSQEIFDSLSPEAKYEVIQIQKENLIEVSNRGFSVTEKGWPFIRNICMIFDARHHKQSKNKKDLPFSTAI